MVDRARNAVGPPAVARHHLAHWEHEAEAAADPSAARLAWPLAHHPDPKDPEGVLDIRWMLLADPSRLCPERIVSCTAFESVICDACVEGLDHQWWSRLHW